MSAPTAEDRERLAGGWLTLPESQGAELALVELALPRPPPPPPEGPRVYDLCRGDARLADRAVALLPPGDRLRLAFASDLHVARAWSELVAALRDAAPDLAPSLIDPEEKLAAFVAEANRLGREGALDLVVLGGDLVDHVLTGPPGRSSGGNVERLLCLLDDLELPAFAIPGNHDYRLHPWRPRIVDLSSVGVPPRRRRALLRAAGRWERAPLRPRDFHAVRTSAPEHPHALRDHLRRLAPSTDFSARAGSLTLVFANSGRDALFAWTRLAGGRWRALADSLLAPRAAPPSEGLYRGQLERIEEELARAEGVALFVHAPLLPGSGLGRGGLTQHRAPLLARLRERRSPAAVFSGHIHRAGAHGVDRDGRFRDLPFPVSGDPDLLLATAPALGFRAPGGDPGYLLASFERGRLTRLERRAAR